MDEIIPTNEYTVVDNVAYVNPQVALDESNRFIDNYQATQAKNTAQIASDTQKLGTDTPSSQGGLIGGDSYFTSRYQTPQTASAIADLRATAQAKALNDVYSALEKKAQNDYYNAAQKQANAAAASAAAPGSKTKGEVEYKTPDAEDAAGTISSVGTLSLPAGSGNITMVQVDDEIQYINDDTGEVVITDLDGNLKRRNTGKTAETGSGGNSKQRDLGEVLITNLGGKFKR